MNSGKTMEASGRIPWKSPSAVGDEFHSSILITIPNNPGMPRECLAVPHLQTCGKLSENVVYPEKPNGFADHYRF